MLIKINGKKKTLKLNQDEEMLRDMVARQVDTEQKEVPDVVFYKDGPQYVAELVEMKDGTYEIEDLRKVQEG